MKSYSIHKFRVNSEIALPADEECFTDQTAALSLNIVKAPLRNRAKGLRFVSKRTAYDVGDGILSSWHGLIFHISFDGRNIQVETPPEAEVLAAKWLLNRGFGASMLLQGGIPLHAAGVEIENRRVAIVAASGTGKSTLLWYLVQNGALFGSDDLVALDFSSSQILAQSSISLFPKLSRLSLTQSGLSLSDFQETFSGSDEYWIPLQSSQRADSARALDAIYFLSPNDTGKPSVHQLHEEEKIRALAENTHAVGAVLSFLNSRRIHTLFDRMKQEIPMFQLNYQKNWQQLPNLCQFLCEHVSQLSASHEREEISHK